MKRNNRLWIIPLIALIILTIACGSGEEIVSKVTPIEQETDEQVLETQETQSLPVKTSLSTEAIKPSNTSLPTQTPKPTHTKTATNTSTNTPMPTATIDANLIEPGTYVVGVDIQPGIYKGIAGEGIWDSCYWERLSDLSGSFSSILANSNSSGPFYVEVKDTDYAFKTDCEVLALESVPTPTEFLVELGPGTYLVGRDIEAGIYGGVVGEGIWESCYWERLASVAGGFDAIIANDNSEGKFYVEVKETDFAFSIACDAQTLDTLPVPEEFLVALSAGTYLVGRDIQPGLYKGQAGDDSCYWERLSDVSGSFSAILANDNAEGQFYIEVKPTDFALNVRCNVTYQGE